jgi:ketosteroid isomerase-like protein
MLLGQATKGGTMGEAQEVMNQLTDALLSRDKDAATKLYASDAVAVTPDQGEIRSQKEIVEWSNEFFDVFPDVQYESLYVHESGNTAIGEGYFVGTHTGPLRSPTGRASLRPAGLYEFAFATSARSRTGSSRVTASTSTRWSSLTNSG